MMDPEPSATGGRLLAWPAVRERVGISRTTAWRLQNAGQFPLPVVISAGRVGWREEEIAAWAASRTSRASSAPEPAHASALRPSGLAPPAPPLARSANSRRPKPHNSQLGFDF